MSPLTRAIGAAGEGHYAVVRGWAGRPEYGNAMLLRQPLHPTELDRLDLGIDRSIHRALIALPNGSTVLFAVTHLHHIAVPVVGLLGAHISRSQQRRAVTRRSAHPLCDAVIALTRAARGAASPLGFCPLSERRLWGLTSMGT